jgi:hypothetical protein
MWLLPLLVHMTLFILIERQSSCCLRSKCFFGGMHSSELLVSYKEFCEAFRTWLYQNLSRFFLIYATTWQDILPAFLQTSWTIQLTTSMEIYMLYYSTITIYFLFLKFLINFNIVIWKGSVEIQPGAEINIHGKCEIWKLDPSWYDHYGFHVVYSVNNSWCRTG